MKYFKPNQTVYSPKFGEGIVAAITDDRNYPVMVQYPTGIASYTADGKIWKQDSECSLFTTPPKFTPNTPIDIVQVGDWIVITADKATKDFTSSMHKYHNRVLKITEVFTSHRSNHQYVKVYGVDDYAFCEEFNHFRLAEKHEIPCCGTKSRIPKAGIG